MNNKMKKPVLFVIMAALLIGAYVCIYTGVKANLYLNDFNDKAVEGFSNICFIIGSSHGLSDRIKQMSHYKMSMSKMTFPHQLMRVILLEAIYRSFTIIAGKKYHK